MVTYQLSYQLRYMKRRCEFVDNLPSFNYNLGHGEYTVDENRTRIVTNTVKLGSTLMTAMLKEVSDFCDADIKENWASKPHKQVQYIHFQFNSFCPVIIIIYLYIYTRGDHSTIAMYPNRNVYT